MAVGQQAGGRMIVIAVALQAPGGGLCPAGAF